MFWAVATRYSPQRSDASTTGVRAVRQVVQRLLQRLAPAASAPQVHELVARDREHPRADRQRGVERAALQMERDQRFLHQVLHFVRQRLQATREETAQAGSDQQQRPCDRRFVEVHAENYMARGGPFLAHLQRVRERHALSVHGVGLSIGGTQPLDADHLERLAALVQRFEPQWYSEHLAWSNHGGIFNDLLPVTYA